MDPHEYRTQMDKSLAIEAVDLAGDRQVPALAPALLGATMSSTNRITDSILEDKDREIKQLRRRVFELEDGARVVRKLHSMLEDPRYAKRLILLLEDLGPSSGKVFDEDEVEPLSKRW